MKFTYEQLQAASDALRNVRDATESLDADFRTLYPDTSYTHGDPLELMAAAARLASLSATLTTELAKLAELTGL